MKQICELEKERGVKGVSEVEGRLKITNVNAFPYECDVRVCENICIYIPIYGGTVQGIARPFLFTLVSLLYTVFLHRIGTNM